MGDLDIISNAELFRGLSTEQKKVLAAVSHVVQLAEGEYLCRIGDEASHIYIVRSGVVELSLPVDVERLESSVVVEDVSRGETVGWSALAPPYKYTLDARAAVDTALIAIERADFESVCDDEPALGRVLLRNVVATIGHRLRVVHAMWVRELKRNVRREYAEAG